ncbi:hypothetical protein BOX15_Mlig005574g2 [Macrostomum lignano]|uniref:Uncharacterized protein n=1 Tax=Macrostomum lignano TaxID=282301 RepID=A0A267FA18_9PLAT|nr:hypothetical protein BOX15_Mlig005574g2 [Macrostomum lignano]
MTAATTYATAMPIDDESNNDQFGGSDTEEDKNKRNHLRLLLQTIPSIATSSSLHI